MTEKHQGREIIYKSKSEHADIEIWKKPAQHNYSADGIQLVRLDSLSGPVNSPAQYSQLLPENEGREALPKPESNSIHSPIKRTRGI